MCTFPAEGEKFSARWKGQRIQSVTLNAHIQQIAVLLIKPPGTSGKVAQLPQPVLERQLEIRL